MTSRAFVLCLLATLTPFVFASCCSTETRPATTVRRPRPAALRDVSVRIVKLEDGTNAVLIAPLDAFEANEVEKKRERDQLRASPFWSDERSE